MLNKFTFEIDNKKINLYTDVDIVYNKLVNDQKSFLKTIPCKIYFLGKVDKIADSGNFITVLNSNDKNINVDKEKNIINMRTKPNEFRFPDLLYATLGMFSNLLKNYDTYLLHSAAVTNEMNKSILLLGDPGSGKSTLAFHLMKNYNYKLLSNDITVIAKRDNKVKVLGGTTCMQMRLGAIKLYYPELINQIDYEQSDRNDWDIKPYVNNVISDKISNKNDTDVNTICHITTSDNLDFSIRIDEYVDNYLYIYEQLIRQIRNTRNLIVGYNYPLESFETPLSNKNVESFAEYIAKNVNMYDARGDIKTIAKELVYRNEK